MESKIGIRVLNILMLLASPYILTPALIALFVWGFFANEGTAMRATFGILIVKAIIIGFFIYPRLWGLMQTHVMALALGAQPGETRTHQELVKAARRRYEITDEENASIAAAPPIDAVWRIFEREARWLKSSDISYSLDLDDESAKHYIRVLTAQGQLISMEVDGQEPRYRLA